MRRLFFALAALAPTVSALEAPAPLQPGPPLYFEARYKDKPAGFLKIEASRQDGQLVVKQTEQLTLTKMMIKVKMDQTIEGRWTDQRLDGLTAHTAMETTLGDKAIDLQVARTAEGLQATAENKTTKIPADAWPLMPWHRAFLSHGALFDAAQGQAVTVQATTTGVIEIMKTDDAVLRCERVNVVADLEGTKSKISLWYEPSGRLCAMVREGDVGPVIYRRMDRARS